MPAPERAGDKKARRAAEAEKERERRARVRAAEFGIGDVPRNVLADVPAAFAAFDRHGLALDLTFAAPGLPSWTPELADFAFELTRQNMRALYEAAPDWGWKDAKKRAELADAASRYVVVRDRATGAPVAFVVFRFVMEGDVDVLYVYELQLSAGVQRKGLGKHLMVLMELIARRTGMQWCALAYGVGVGLRGMGCGGRRGTRVGIGVGASALENARRARRCHRSASRVLAPTRPYAPAAPRRVFLTVLRSNVAAYDFYTKMRYTVDEGSPSRSGMEGSHEILSKAIAPAPTPAKG